MLTTLIVSMVCGLIFGVVSSIPDIKCKKEETYEEKLGCNKLRMRLIFINLFVYLVVFITIEKIFNNIVYEIIGMVIGYGLMLYGIKGWLNWKKKEKISMEK